MEKETIAYRRMTELHNLAVEAAKNGIESDDERFLFRRDRKINRLNIKALKTIFHALEDDAKIRALVTIRYLETKI